MASHAVKVIAGTPASKDIRFLTKTGTAVGVPKRGLGMQRPNILKRLSGTAKVAEVVRQVADGTYVSVDFEGDPWDRQTWEIDSAWNGFVIYRDMGPQERSVSKVAKAIGKHQNNVYPWSKNNRWVERAALYDRYVDQRAREAKLKAFEEATERHVKIGMVFQQVAARELTKINQRSAAATIEVLTPEQILRYAEQGIRTERLARGEPESITQEKHELSVADKRKQLAAVAVDQASAPLIEQLADRMMDAVHLPDTSAETDRE